MECNWVFNAGDVGMVMDTDIGLFILLMNLGDFVETALVVFSMPSGAYYNR